MDTIWFREGDGPLRPMKGAKLTIVCPAADYHRRLSYDGFTELTFQRTIQRPEEVVTFHPETERLFRKVFPDYAGDFWPSTIRREGMGMQHVAGLIDLSLEIQDQGGKYVWKYPESGLHPSAVLELADVMIELMVRAAGR